ncbi:MAG: DUF5317 domain-containing protein [Anaerolineales bacterium]|nr:DUF5317 domain-containing protein [Anaerolineales bacterium]
MILLLAVLAGALAGLARARCGGCCFQLGVQSHVWLIFLSVFIQGLAFYFPPTRGRMPDQLAACFLISSQIGLLMFVWLNRKQPGLSILGAGLVLNLLVIVANGGLMPISPEVAHQLVPTRPVDAWETGVRFGWSKDILLAKTDTFLWWLSDCLVSPPWFLSRVAFSPGDVLVAIGAFWFFWVRGGPQEQAIR